MKFRVMSIFLEGDALNELDDLHETLAMSNTLDLADTVDGKVDVFELPQLVEPLHL
jgi:hypothetical protein